MELKLQIYLAFIVALITAIFVSISIMIFGNGEHWMFWFAIICSYLLLLFNYLFHKKKNCLKENHRENITKD